MSVAASRARREPSALPSYEERISIVIEDKRHEKTLSNPSTTYSCGADMDKEKNKNILEEKMLDAEDWLTSVTIGVVGVGYVGLPLAVEFGKKFPVVAYDSSVDRISELRRGYDKTLEIGTEELQSTPNIVFTSNYHDLEKCNVFIVTVPTPIDIHKRPDLRPLLQATRDIGTILKRGDTVVYESTVFPGCTEEECVPVLEKMSSLRLNIDFNVGYSPERINPADKTHRLVNIVKVTSGSSPRAASRIDALYRKIVKAGTHQAESIKVAEAAKVIENTQRDVNIALINELAIIFKKLGISTEQILKAAETKWNFLPFRPGLVGGHCIGVDPYYLTFRAQQAGYLPEVILAGRRINDGMGQYIADQVLKLMIKSKINPVESKVLIMGLTFKENCPDVRNSKVSDIVAVLVDCGIKVELYDPWANSETVEFEYGITPLRQLHASNYDVVLVAVGHNQFRLLSTDDLRALSTKDKCLLYDVKYLFSEEQVDGRL